MIDLIELIELISRGGVYYNLSGKNPVDVLAEAVDTIPVPGGVSKEDLLRAILERESLMPTGIGDGIAIPHPRSPMVADPAERLVSVCFLQQPIDWPALDGRPVGTLFILLSSTPKDHLKTLSSVNYLCRLPTFRALLQARSSREELTAAIAAAEKTWR